MCALAACCQLPVFVRMGKISNGNIACHSNISINFFILFLISLDSKPKLFEIVEVLLNSIPPITVLLQRDHELRAPSHTIWQIQFQIFRSSIRLMDMSMTHFLFWSAQAAAATHDGRLENCVCVWEMLYRMAKPSSGLRHISWYMKRIWSHCVLLWEFYGKNEQKIHRRLHRIAIYHHARKNKRAD